MPHTPSLLSRIGNPRLWFPLGIIVLGIFSFLGWQHFYPVQAADGWSLRTFQGGIPMVSAMVIDGRDISNYSPKQLTAYRRTDIGFVFQFYNLVANLTAKENVELASQIVSDAQDAVKVLEDVGLGDRVDNFPAQLSGGEQQRVAIARAVAKNPKILLCDEPTGALDYNTGKQVLQILQDMSRKKGATVVIVTHNSAIAPIADRVIRMHDGKVTAVDVNEHPMDIAELEW